MLGHVVVKRHDRGADLVACPPYGVTAASSTRVLTQTERDDAGSGAHGCALDPNLVERVQTNVLLEAGKGRRYRLEGVHGAAGPDDEGRREREQPDVSSDVEHDIVRAQERFDEPQLLWLVTPVEDPPLCVVGQVEAHAKAVDSGFGGPVGRGNVRMQPLDDNREPAGNRNSPR